MARHLYMQNSITVNGISDWQKTSIADNVGVEIVEFATDNPLDQDTLGLRLCGSRSVGVFVNSIHGGSAADLSGKIHAGDQMLQVDDVVLTGLTPDQVVRVLRSSLANTGRAKITVAHPWADKPSTSSRPYSPTTISSSYSDGQLSVQINTVASPSATPSVSTNTSNSRPTKGLKSATKKMVLEVEVHPRISRSKVAPAPPSAVAEKSVASATPAPTSITPPAASALAEKVSRTETCETTDDSSSIHTAATGTATVASAEHTRNYSRRKSENDVFKRFTVKSASTTTFDEKDDNSLNVPSSFNSKKPAISYEGFFASVERKSFRKQISTEELPLVSFDQLNQSTSPGQAKKNERNDSSQSKSSKGSNRSNQSQELSWHCPVCLDGASRIQRTKRRMMSTVCGHVFCSRCVEDVINKYKMCPTCRTTLYSMSEVHPLFM